MTFKKGDKVYYHKNGLHPFKILGKPSMCEGIEYYTIQVDFDWWKSGKYDGLPERITECYNLSKRVS